jgi:hypothetical protein
MNDPITEQIGRLMAALACGAGPRGELIGAWCGLAGQP